MDFDNLKVYRDTSISEGPVFKDAPTTPVPSNFMDWLVTCAHGGDDNQASSVMEAKEYLQLKDRMTAAKNVAPTHCRHHHYF